MVKTTGKKVGFKPEPTEKRRSDNRLHVANNRANVKKDPESYRITKEKDKERAKKNHELKKLKAKSGEGATQTEA
jgi:hypothetical protein